MPKLQMTFSGSPVQSSIVSLSRARTTLAGIAKNVIRNFSPEGVTQTEDHVSLIKNSAQIFVGDVVA